MAALFVILACASSFAGASTSRMTPREKAIHALNRLGFGPRPGDVDRVEAMGVSAWIAAQLEPERIPDPIAGAKMADLPTLAMSQPEIFENFERPLREARQRRKQAAASMSAAEGAAAETDLAEALPPAQRPRRLIEELSSARVLRAAYSERQANEVLVDFWMNHFNVFANKGLDRVLVTSFERDTVRPRIWGRFEDLLLATATSPAMLFYLDNAQSVAEPDHRPQRRGPAGLRWPLASAFEPPPARPFGNRRGGLNENYARELMELHTLGVDGGYTQKDVTELARVLTGWSIEPRSSGEFVFRERVHDVGGKAVLGHAFAPGGGIEEGVAMIRILARHPATARHIALELCQRLVADDPPASLVERVAKRFLATDGDLRQTVKAVVDSPEFFDPKNYRAKVKSPFEYVVSAIRAAGGETNARPPLLREIGRMGEPLYLCQPPTGYSDAASAWVNTGALVARLNFALALASNRIPGTTIALERLVSPEDAADPKRAVDALARVLVGGDLSGETRRTIEKRIENPTAAASTQDPSANTELPLIAGLILGSPEFQRQ